MNTWYINSVLRPNTESQPEYIHMTMKGKKGRGKGMKI